MAGVNENIHYESNISSAMVSQELSTNLCAPSNTLLLHLYSRASGVFLLTTHSCLPLDLQKKLACAHSFRSLLYLTMKINQPGFR